MKKVIFLCGLIGSGKTTFARKKFQFVTDLDFMPPGSKKKDQILLTKRLLTRVPAVCHITCFPTFQELEAFKNYDVSFLLLDTSFEQCRINILKRNRSRDIANLSRALEANKNYIKKIRNVKLPFSMIRFEAVD